MAAEAETPASKWPAEDVAAVKDMADAGRAYQLALHRAAALGDVVPGDDVTAAAGSWMGLLLGLLRREWVRRGEPEPDAATLVRHIKEDLGYLGGYQDDTARARIEDLYDCYHPLFGRIKETGPVSAAEAFALGQVAAAVGADQRAGIRETFVAMKRLQQGQQRRAEYDAGEWPSELEPEDA